MSLSNLEASDLYLQLLLFNIGPIFFDIGIALVFFFYLFGWPLALVILVVMVAYGENILKFSL